MKKFLTTTALVLLLAGCSTTTARFSDEMPPVTPQYKEMQHFFVAGIAQEKIVEPNEICMMTGVNTIKTYYSFVDGVAAVFTGGIWTPNTIEVYCNRPKK